MIVKLAGFNVDIENINYLNELLKKGNLSSDDLDILKKFNWTPETISASYARISRDARPINELREEARNEVEKARKSNNLIIFTMGHSSIAEHAVFNIDIVNISRLVAEPLEKSRLASFTEKSQRYIKIGEDIYIPKEFQDDSKILNEYKEITKRLFIAYETIHEKLVPYFKEKYPVTDEKSTQYRDVVNLAKEDARYILPLGILTQVGMTANARTYEKLIRKLSSSDLSEAKELGNAIYNEIKNYAPSLIKYTNPSLFETETYKEIKTKFNMENDILPENEVELINYPKDFEDKLVTMLLMKSSNCSYNSAKKRVETMSDNEKLSIFDLSIKYLNSYDSVLKEYESGEFEFNILISATAFAQLKRHRMATMIDGEYSPKLGVVIPQSIIDVGLKDYFNEQIDIVNAFYDKINKKYPSARDYILTNAHRKNVYFKCNFRELVHLCRLRMDKHSQWDIRNIATLMANLVKEKYKFIGLLLVGKDSFKKD
ncbi:MAG TPA: FAD-dependent thymidylate synthase [Spirochaetota bacterium]|nr:FAD-dependent thymidylate synthase [Spirochaetota bacterium]